MREKTQNKCLVGYSCAYPKGRERGFFSSSLELEIGIGDCLVRGFDRINGIYRIGRWRRGL